MEPLLNSVPHSYRYVDDVGLLAVAKTTSAAATKAAELVEKVDCWAQSDGLALEWSKAEFQHLHRTRQPSAPISL